MIIFLKVTHLITFRRKSISSDTRKNFGTDAKREKERQAKEDRFSFYLVLSETCLYVGDLIVTKDEVCRDKNLEREVSSICVLLETRDT